MWARVFMVYYFENGIRRVKPYYYDFATTFKERWRNSTIKQILCRELGQKEDAVDHGIATGKIYVCSDTNKKIPRILSPEECQNHLLRNHDVIHNLQHMHEPAIYNDQIPILYEDDNLLIVSKPAGMPTHPSGSYRNNTLTHILRKNFQLATINPCHRLDKATLGIVVLAKNARGRELFLETFNDKEATEKWYVARVNGEFPNTESPMSFSGPVFLLNFGGYVNVRNSRNVPTSSTTQFIRSEFFPATNESVVLCRPITGKMHQIRIHLRNLGFPISNDYLYNPSRENRAATMKNDLELQIYDKLPQTENDHVDVENAIDAHLRKQLLLLASLRDEKNTRVTEEVCNECKRTIYKDHPDHGIFLHASRLVLNGNLQLDIRAPLPKWANVQDYENMQDP